ncbi:60S ribosomal protein L7A-2 [Anaeramoeba ignava]|uniref:60S ribosomal protein L7a n=1 Tax=Anaeramoeba ignava TaxID=1746090 RepID=A0A9Q0L763_ANAIG|nr:60S ribosomal protein L7A-2 [Anaeramoeba ignava]
MKHQKKQKKHQKEKKEAPKQTKPRQPKKRVTRKDKPEKVSVKSGTKKVTEDKFGNIYQAKPARTNAHIFHHKSKDLRHVMVWPKYVRLQRQKKILLKRLRIPPAINQFSHTLKPNHSKQLLSLLNKYRPEDRKQKKARLRAIAQAKVEGRKLPKPKKPVVVKYGINHVTSLVEHKKAQLVVIAHDVDPIELVVWLPALCRKMDVPYCIVKGKSQLGQVVHKKTATALVLTEVNEEDQLQLANLIKVCRHDFNSNTKAFREWGNGILSTKTLHKLKAKKKSSAAVLTEKFIERDSDNEDYMKIEPEPQKEETNQKN